MVIIRLSRTGAKKRPFYNMLVCDSRARRNGRFIERIGFYNPLIAEGAQRLTYDAARVQFWVEKGAKLSDTVARILKADKAAKPAAVAE